LNEKGLNDDAKDILEYKNVFLKYDNDDTFILKNVSFNIKRNSKIGIIGRYLF
jgi:ABC-type multidrug transport system fused ATPase/permease subunit